MLAQLNAAKLRKSQPTVVTDALGRKTNMCEKFYEKDGQVVNVSSDGAGYVVDTNPDKDLHEVIPRLFIGSQDAATNDEQLKTCGITHILNVATGVTYNVPQGVKYLALEILDLPDVDITQFLPDACEFLRIGTSSSHAALVHCNAGVSRSASIVIGFLMIEHKMSYDNAHAITKKARASVQPNAGFAKQLKQIAPL